MASRHRTRRKDTARRVEARPDDARPSRWRRVALALSPERAFLILGLIVGLVLVFVTPPFQVPDEPQHFYRAFQVSELRPLALVALQRGRHVGALLPKSLATLVEESGVVATRFRPANKVDAARFLALRHAPLNPHDREYLPVAAYPPLGYVPQAVGIGVGRLAGASPLVLLYLARLGALVAWLALVFLAIRTTPVLKWTYALLGLMPMTLYLAASTSVDSVVIGASFLLSARILSWAYDPAKDRIGRGEIGWVIGLAVVVALSKAVYLPLLLLLLLVPWTKFQTRARQMLTTAVIVAISLAAYAGWALLAGWATAPGPTIDMARHVVDGSHLPDVSPARQVAFIRSHPLAFLKALVTTVSVPGILFYYLNSFVGMLGWLDTLLPTWLPYAYLAVVILVSLASGSPAAVGWTGRVVGLTAFAATAFVALTFLYIGYSSVGMIVVGGFQGRYLIPSAPALFLVFHNHGARFRITGLAAAALVAFVVTTSSVAAHRLVERFYVAEVPWFAIEGTAVSPGGDAMIVRGWAVDRATRALAEGVEVELDGRPYRARYGLERNDVARRLGRPTYQFSGFEARIPFTEVPRGRHTLALRIVGKGGQSDLIPESRRPLDIK